MEECPSSDCTIFGCLPLLNSSVAKAVEREPLILQARLLQQNLELPVVEVAVIHRLTHTVREDEVMILPEFA